MYMLYMNGITSALPPSGRGSDNLYFVRVFVYQEVKSVEDIAIGYPYLPYND